MSDDPSINYLDKDQVQIKTNFYSYSGKNVYITYKLKSCKTKYNHV